MGFANRTPRTIENSFKEHHIDMVFKELHERFNLNVKYWKREYESQLKTQLRNVDELGFFLKFCNTHINPSLNSLLGRYSHHPTFNKLVEYVLNKSF